MRISLFLTVALAAFSATAIAQTDNQDQDQGPSYQITVTGDRLEEPVIDKSDAITVITRQEIEAAQWNYVLDAIRQVPGITVVQSGSPGKVTSVFFRGAGSSQVLVLLDGVPLNNPYFGGVDLENLTTDNVERIEVLKGPQSPLYGSDSIGGVIEIITRQGRSGKAVHSSFEGGSFQTYREKVGVTGRQDNVDYSVTFSRQDSDGQQINDQFRENVVSGKGNFRLNDKTRFSTVGHFFDSKIGIPINFLFDPVTFAPFIAPSPDQKQHSKLGVAGASLVHNSGQLFNLTANFDYTRRNFFYQNPGTFFPLSTNSSNVYQMILQNDFHLNESDILTAGYEFEHQDTDAADQNGPFPLNSVNDNGVFVQNKFDHGPWILTAGVRHDHYDTFGDTTNPRVSVAYRWHREVKFRSSFATGFRAPSAGDLSLPFYGNPNLKPEKSRSWEVGADKYWGNRAAFAFSVFHNKYEDLITFDPNTLIAGNVAKARTQGFELSASIRNGFWMFGGGYTYLDSKDEITGLRLARRPKHSGSLRAAYQTETWGANVNLLAIGDRLENDFLTSPVINRLNPGYGKLDIAGFYRINAAFKLTGRVENLTDKRYEEVLYYPALGRGFYVGVEAEF